MESKGDTVTTTTQEFIKKLRAFSIPLTGVPNFVEAEYLMKESADALEALQAELDEWRFTNKIDELQRVNEGLQAEVARLEAGLRLSQASGNAWKAGWESTLALLEAVEAQNLMSRQIILEHGSGTIAAAGASLVATPIVAWAKSTPRKLRITTMDMCGEDGWRPLGYTAAGASPVEPSQALELELSDAEIKKISSDLSLYEDYQPESCQADYLDPVKFARAIIAAINAKGQPNG